VLENNALAGRLHSFNVSLAKRLWLKYYDFIPGDWHFVFFAIIEQK